jgi:hypothetical protein
MILIYNYQIALLKLFWMFKFLDIFQTENWKFTKILIFIDYLKDRRPWALSLYRVKVLFFNIKSDINHCLGGYWLKKKVTSKKREDLTPKLPTNIEK